MLGSEWENVRLGRTKGRKPFVADPNMRPSNCGNFNYSVAHDVGNGTAGGQFWWQHYKYTMLTWFCCLLEVKVSIAQAWLCPCV